MAREYQTPIYQHPWGRSFVRYAYACNGCNKPVEGYINAKVYGKVWCAKCKKKNADSWKDKKQDEHDKQVRADVLQELFLLAKENAYEDGVDYSIGLQVLDNLIEELKEQNK